ncbi:TVP38/TMEM64 family inner membrane protein YdjZ [Bythopirellula polymerisocia]|uniref:TVP38/TMEM64 family membrane protein n=1 Tax=Bythopirellula polymerisocia TaxID=2528003 RepID=A0A5C6CYY7_9BACT|nr:TVP38/TMEM64 family inner membrane protein YdjZ [Bythopirellula polymerisocia]
MLLNSGATADEKVESLRAFFDRFGVAAPLAYVGFVTAEVVVAPIPGTMLYAPGGVIFGGFWGGLLSLTGNVIGAGIACLLMRAFLGERAETYLARSSLAPYEAKITQRGAWVIFLLRVNPLTSSDLVSYAAGLTQLSVWKVMLATLAGMAPLCFAQAFMAEGLLTAFPLLIFPLLSVCAVYALVVLWVLSKLMKKSTDDPSRLD